MVRKVNDSHVVNMDLTNTIDNIVSVNPQLNSRIDDAFNKTNLFICEVLRFYPINDKALVKILNTGEKVYCYLTHDILSSTVSLQSMVDGSVATDNKLSSYIVPHSTIYGVVALVRNKGLNEDYCLISCLNLSNDFDLKSNVDAGEIKLVAGDSSISVDKDRVNILCPELFINGLPFSEPEFDNIHTVDEINDIISTVEKEIIDKKNIVDIIYPVGSIYMSVNDVDPSVVFGGVWERIEDTFLLSSGSNYNLGATGGEETHTLTVDEMPTHNHTQASHRHSLNRNFSTGSGGSASAYTQTSGRTTATAYTDYQTPTINNTGGGLAHNNMPPYLVVNVWERTE